MNIRWLAVAASVVVGLPVFVVLAGVGLFSTELGKRWLVSEITDAVSETGVSEVSISGLEGDLLSRFSIRSATVSDAEGAWLEIGEVSLAWDPWALVGGKLRVASLEAQSLIVDRLPDTPESEGDSGPPAFELPELPVELEVERLAVADLVLREPVAGEAARLTVSSSISLGVGTPSIAIDLRRTDDRAMEARIAASFDPATDALSLDLDVSEQAGGLMADLLGLTEAAPITITLSGRAPVADWRGQLKMAYGTLATGDVRLETRREADAIVVAMKGPFQLSGLAPTDLTDLARDIRLDLEIAAASSGPVTIRRARIESPVLTTEVSGTVEADTMDMALDIAVSVANGAALAGLTEPIAFQRLAFKGRVEGPLAHVRVGADVAIDRLVVDDMTFEKFTARLDAAPHETEADWLKITLKGRADGADLADDDLNPLAAEGIQIGVSASVPLGGGTVKIDAAGLQIPSFVLQLAGSVDPDRGRMRLAGRGQAADLSPFDELAGMDLTGRAILDLKIAQDGSDAPLIAEATMSTSDVSVGIAELDALLGQAPEAHLTVTVLEGKPRYALSLTGVGLDLRAEPELDSRFRQVDAAVDGRLDLDFLAPEVGVEMSGEVAVTGTMSGLLRDPDFDLKLTTPKANLAGKGPFELAVDATALKVASGANGSVAISGQGPYGPVKLTARYAVIDNKRLDLADVALEAQGATAAGTATVPFDGAPLGLALAVRAKSLSAWSDLAGMDLAGSVDGRVEMKPTDGSQGLSAQLTFAALELDGTGFDRLQTEVNGTFRKLTVAIDGERAAPPRLSLKARAEAELESDPIKILVRTLTASIEDRKIALTRPATLSILPDGFAAEGLSLDLDGGSLAASGRINGDRVQVSADLTRLPLALIEAVSGEPGPQGYLSGKLALEGALDDPSGTLDLSLEGVALPSATGVTGKPVNGRVTGSWQAGRFKVDARIEGFADADLVAKLDLPLVMRDGAPTMPESAPIRGTVTGGGDAGLIWELVPLPEHVIEGRLDLDLKVAGTLASPQLSGGLGLADGRYENLEQGTLIDDLTVTTDLSVSRQVRFTARGTDGGKGTISVEGTITLDGERGYPLSIVANLEKAKVLRRDDITAALSGRAEVDGTVSALSIKARLETKGVDILISNQLPADIVELDVIEINAPGGDQVAVSEDGPESGASGAGSGTVSLDVLVEMPNRVNVRGFGVDSEWKGRLKVTGTAAAPRIEGGLESVHGRVDFLGKTFELEDSSVDFAGGDNLEPHLNIVAVHEATGLTATVRITGTASDPQIALSSVPELPQDEVISRVLFGRSSGSLGLLEAAQLAQVAANLASGDFSGGGGGGFLDKVRDFVGLDRLQVESGEGGISASTASVAKYITGEVLVGFKQGINPGSGAVTVELEVTPQISVKSELAETGQSKLGVFWSMDY